MGSLTRSGATCPQCHMPVHLRRDGSMVDHKTDKLTVTGLPGRRTKQACPYGGVTVEEAKAGKTRVAKRREQHREKQAAGTTQRQRLRGSQSDPLPPELQRKTTKRPTSTPTGPTPDVVDAVLERDMHSCVVCGNNLHGTRGQDYSIHHRRPKGMGGDTRWDTHLPQNLISVCGRDNQTGCHGWIHSNPNEAGDQGFLLSKFSNPLTQPMGAWYGAVFLTARGKLRHITDEAAA